MFGLYWDNGKENGKYFFITGDILGLYWENGKENGKHYLGLRVLGTCNPTVSPSTLTKHGHGEEWGS